MRYATSMGDGDMQIVDFQTLGPSEEWKQNVLSNTAIRDIQMQQLKPGRHIIKIYTVDPDVVLDRTLINFGNLPQNYRVIAETLKIIFT